MRPAFGEAAAHRFHPTILREYDIRGIVPNELTRDLAYRTGRALVQYLGAGQVAVGRDMRVSGEALSGALIDGVRDQGADVVDFGLVSTDALYFAVGKFGFPAGVMITASHNPASFNGFKVKSQAGSSADPAFTKELEKRGVRQVVASRSDHAATLSAHSVAFEPPVSTGETLPIVTPCGQYRSTKPGAPPC